MRYLLLACFFLTGTFTFAMKKRGHAIHHYKTS